MEVERLIAERASEERSFDVLLVRPAAMWANAVQPPVPMKPVQERTWTHLGKQPIRTSGAEKAAAFATAFDS